MIRYRRDAKSRSAFGVVTPAAPARFEYKSPSAISISDADFTMCVEERWTIVISAPFSHSAAQMSWAELLEPMMTAFLPT